MEWVQLYDPLGSAWLSTLAAASPILVLFLTLALLEWPAQRAALAGLLTALAVSTLVYGMPVRSAAVAAVYGAAFGLFPIGWIILNAVFLYNLTVAAGQFDVVKASVAGLSTDRRIQALLVAFSFGAFIEGAAGFGAPVAISAALMIGLGFNPLYAACLALLANTAPVAFGSIGIPIITLGAVTGLSADSISAMAGRQLPLISVIIPAWLVVTMSGWRGLRGVWPAVLVAGGSFAVVQALWSNLVGPELVDIMGGLVSLVSTGLFSWRWPPSEPWDFPHERGRAEENQRAAQALRPGRGATVTAWMPWIMLSVLVMLWGIGPVKAFLTAGPAGVARYATDGTIPGSSRVLAPSFDVPFLHQMVYREFPVRLDRVDRTRLQDPAYKNARAEAAQFSLNWLSATGSGILIAALLAALYLRMSWGEVWRVWRKTLYSLRWPLVTIAMMLALGFVTRYGGSDATLGLAFTNTGRLYPFFAAFLGWLGVALTGSDTSSNVLFGSLQKITAEQLGLSPVLITTANSTGGVMGKMIAAQSIVVATAATGQTGHEGRILRFVFWHSIALATLMGIIVMLQAYVVPWIIPKG